MKVLQALVALQTVEEQTQISLLGLGQEQHYLAMQTEGPAAEFEMSKQRLEVTELLNQDLDLVVGLLKAEQ